jgi:hypothetical protein
LAGKEDKVRQSKPRACEYLRMMLLARQPDALQDLTEALGVYDNRELLDKEHMYKRFNPQVMPNYILQPVSNIVLRTNKRNMLFTIGC